VLGIGVAAELERLTGLDDGSREREFTGVELLIVDDVEVALQRLNLRLAEDCVVVIDPTWAAAAREASQRLLLALAFERRPARVVLWGAPTLVAMHGVARCARWLACDVVVRDVEDARLAEIVGEACAQLKPVRDRGTASIARDRTSSDALRDAWSWAALEPQRATVKVVAARLGVSRRSLERWHRTMGLPTPARMLELVLQETPSAPIPLGWLRSDRCDTIEGSR
jgi:hypothetical protein